MALILAGSITAVVGAARADVAPMTWDEAITFAIVDRPFKGFISVLRTEGVAMAPYHIGLWVWTQFGESDWWVRMFSVLGGALTVCLTFVLGRRWFGAGAGVAASIALLANPFFQRHLTDARTYSWLMAIGLMTVLAADNLIHRTRKRDVAALGLLVGIGLASHITFVTVVGALFVALLASRSINRPLFPRLVVAGAVAAVTALPAIFLLVTRRDELAQNAPATPFRFMAVTSTALGSTPTSALVLVGIGALFVEALIKKRRDWPTACVLSMSAGPAFLLAAISFVADDLYNSRYLTPMLPFAALAAVAGFSVLWPSRFDTLAPALAAAVLLVAGCYGPSVDKVVQADPISAAAYLKGNVKPGDAVLFEPAYSRIFLARYWGYRPGADVLLLGRDESSLYPPLRPIEDVQQELRAAPSIWVVTLQSDSEIQLQVQSNRLANKQSFGKLWVTELTLPST